MKSTTRTSRINNVIREFCGFDGKPEKRVINNHQCRLDKNSTDNIFLFTISSNLADKEFYLSSINNIEAFTVELPYDYDYRPLVERIEALGFVRMTDIENTEVYIWERDRDKAYNGGKLSGWIMKVHKYSNSIVIEKIQKKEV